MKIQEGLSISYKCLKCYSVYQAHVCPVWRRRRDFYDEARKVSREGESRRWSRSRFSRSPSRTRYPIRYSSRSPVKRKLRSLSTERRLSPRRLSKEKLHSSPSRRALSRSPSRDTSSRSSSRGRLSRSHSPRDFSSSCSRERSDSLLRSKGREKRSRSLESQLSDSTSGSDSRSSCKRKQPKKNVTGRIKNIPSNSCSSISSSEASEVGVNSDSENGNQAGQEVNKTDEECSQEQKITADDYVKLSLGKQSGDIKLTNIKEADFSDDLIINGQSTGRNNKMKMMMTHQDKNSCRSDVGSLSGDEDDIAVKVLKESVALTFDKDMYLDASLSRTEPTSAVDTNVNSGVESNLYKIWESILEGEKMEKLRKSPADNSCSGEESDDDGINRKYEELLDSIHQNLASLIDKGDNFHLDLEEVGEEVEDNSCASEAQPDDGLPFKAPLTLSHHNAAKIEKAVDDNFDYRLCNPPRPVEHSNASGHNRGDCHSKTARVDMWTPTLQYVPFHSKNLPMPQPSHSNWEVETPYISRNQPRLSVPNASVSEPVSSLHDSLSQIGKVPAIDVSTRKSLYNPESSKPHDMLSEKAVDLKKLVAELPSRKCSKLLSVLRQIGIESSKGLSSSSAMLILSILNLKANSLKADSNVDSTVLSDFRSSSSQSFHKKKSELSYCKKELSDSSERKEKELRHTRKKDKKDKGKLKEKNVLLQEKGKILEKMDSLIKQKKKLKNQKQSITIDCRDTLKRNVLLNENENLQSEIDRQIVKLQSAIDMINTAMKANNSASVDDSADQGRKTTSERSDTAIKDTNSEEKDYEKAAIKGERTEFSDSVPAKCKSEPVRYWNLLPTSEGMCLKDTTITKDKAKGEACKKDKAKGEAYTKKGEAHEKTISGSHSVKRKEFDGSDEASSPSLKVETEIPSVKKRKISREVEPSPEEMYAPAEDLKPNIQYNDQGMHWCVACSEIFDTIQTYIWHLISSKHLQSNKPFKVPEETKKKSKLKNDNKDSSVPLQEIPIQGVEFLQSCTIFFCSLCDEFIRTEEEAVRHPETKIHVAKYKDYLSKNPMYDSTFIKRKMDAYAQIKIENERKKAEALVETRKAINTLEKNITCGKIRSSDKINTEIVDDNRNTSQHSLCYSDKSVSCETDGVKSKAEKEHKTSRSKESPFRLVLSNIEPTSKCTFSTESGSESPHAPHGMPSDTVDNALPPKAVLPIIGKMPFFKCKRRPVEKAKHPDTTVKPVEAVGCSTEVHPLEINVVDMLKNSHDYIRSKKNIQDSVLDSVSGDGSPRSTVSPYRVSPLSLRTNAMVASQMMPEKQHEVVKLYSESDYSTQRDLSVSNLEEPPPPGVELNSVAYHGEPPPPGV